jgi:hypothetical protein
MRASPTYAEANRQRHLHKAYFQSSENVRSRLKRDCLLRVTVYLKFWQRCQLFLRCTRKSRSLSNKERWSAVPRNHQISVLDMCATFALLAEISILALLTRAAAWIVARAGLGSGVKVL